MQILDEYCSAPLDGNEGRLSHLQDASLTAVVVTIRHGDRSSIHHLPEELDHGDIWNCSHSEVESTLTLLTSSTGGLPQVRSVNGDHAPLERSPFPQRAIGADSCAPGHLTPKGFLQHVNLGRHLRSAYRGLITSLEALDTPPVYVRSTDYTRTIASASALLSSMFVPSAWSKLQVYVNEEENEEVMHGMGLKTSSKVLDANGHEKVLEGGCQKSVASAKAQKKMMPSAEKAYTALEKLFSEAIREKPVVDITDVVKARHCHGMKEPCGPGGCIKSELAESLAKASDEFYCARFYGDHGGRAATKLAMYPFLAEVLRHLQDAADGQGYKLSIFSGHDTVIAPLLAALGAYDCKWPPYASHVIFELWQGKKMENYVRILYNGKAVTQQVDECKEQELCPLASIEATILSILDPHKTFSEACSM